MRAAVHASRYCTPWSMTLAADVDVGVRHLARRVAGLVDPRPALPFSGGADYEEFSGCHEPGITDPAIRALPVIGAADQFIDSTDVLGHCEMSRTVPRALINRN